MKRFEPRFSMGRAVRRLVLAVMVLAGAACLAGRRVPPPPAQTPGGAVRLEVVVKGLRGTRGMVRGALFASATGFPNEHERALCRAEAPARDGAVLVFENLPAGEYALAVLHDEDGDGRMARNGFGIPHRPSEASSRGGSRTARHPTSPGVAFGSLT